MQYYRTPQKFDGRDVYSRKARKWLIMVGGELHTARELLKYGFNPDAFERVEISRRRTFWSFGARFAIED